MANLTTVTLTSGVPTAGSGTVSTLDNVIGTAGTASAQVQTVQGIASMTALKVDGSAVTQPVSIATLPSGAVTNAGTFAVQNTAATPAGTNVIGSVKATDGTNTAAVKAASTAPATTDPALVVALSPNSVNANGRNTPANSAPVVLNSMTGTFVAASATATQLGSTGATGDVLDGVLVIPATNACGAVSVLWDGTNTRTIFAGGGTTALPTLAPFYVPLGFLSGNAGGFKMTTGTNVSVICVGNFT